MAMQVTGLAPAPSSARANHGCAACSCISAYNKVLYVAGVTRNHCSSFQPAFWLHPSLNYSPPRFCARPKILPVAVDGWHLRRPPTGWHAWRSRPVQLGQCQIGQRSRVLPGPQRESPGGAVAEGQGCILVHPRQGRRRGPRRATRPGDAGAHHPLPALPPDSLASPRHCMARTTHRAPSRHPRRL